MRKIPHIIYFLLLAVMVLSLTGCGSDDDEEYYGPDTDRLMVLSSPLFSVGESYKIFRGDTVQVRDLETGNAFTSRYYVAPEVGSDFVAINLQFRDPISPDVPFMITRADNDTVALFYYNPAGTGNNVTTEYGRIVRWGGGAQQLKYSGFGVSGASVSAAAVDIDTSDEIVITLNAEDYIAEADGSDINEYEYVWHADPNHRNEYFTKGNSSTELSEADMLSEIQADIDEGNGVYIAHDIRYMTNELTFTSTAKKDEDTEFVAYYSDSVSTEAARELGSGFEGPYIFATLPANRGQRPQPGDGPNGGPDMPGERPETPPQQAAADDVMNTDIDAFATMTHSAEEAYNNPVLHIVKSGTYRLKGTWHGQIWVDVGEEEDDKVALILDGIEISCDVAPAVVFKKVYECGPTSSIVSFDVSRQMHNTTQTNAGAIVIIAEGSTNNITGSNVYRILQADKKSSATKIDGSDISDQKKLYKMDGAFYSFMSMVIGAEDNRGGGRLNITSTTYEGLDSEMHLLVDSGIIKVTAEDDGINVNEDNTSVFTMDGGSLTVIAKNGDGIDSNGYIVINNGTLDITAAQDSNQLNAQAEGPLDADLGVYMAEGVTYTHQAYTGQSENEDPSSALGSKAPVTIQDEAGAVIFRINYTTPFHDEETTPRRAEGESDIFTLEHNVNSFGDVRIR